MDALTIAAISMQNDLRRLEGISQNLANVMTPAYKRSIPVDRGFATLMQADTITGNAGVPGAGGSGASVIDAGPGTLRATGNPLDLAIEGNGYFELATEGGSAYTRQGNLAVDPRGRLCNGAGQALLGSGGEIHVGSAPFSIDQHGVIRQGGQNIGQLKLVTFTNAQALLPLGNGLMAQGGATIADSAAPAKVRTGYLENSNVSSPQEMIRLSETVRHFESLQRVVQGYDDVFQKAVNKLGDF